MKLGYYFETGGEMYDEFMLLLRKYRERHHLCTDPMTECDVLNEENRFGTLPVSYREFLLQVPTGVFFNEAFILYDGLLSFEDLSLQIRTESEEGLIAFGDNLAGTILCFDTRNPGPDGEWPVVEYVYPDYRVQVANSFWEWIMGMVSALV